ncbi:MAG: hypothetical protein ABWY05_08405 [Noviherbaspirillum sp.]
MLVSDILVSNAECWLRYGPIVFGMDRAFLPAQPAPAAVTVDDVAALFTAANPAAALASWLAPDARRLHWKHPQTGQGLLHFAAAYQNLALVQLLLARGTDPRQPDNDGRTAEQLLPASHSSSHTAVAERIARTLRQ